MSSPSAKRQRSAKDVPYELLYWPGIPGRGEFMRLLFEESGAEYKDHAQLDAIATVKELRGLIGAVGGDNNPPICAPPVLRHGDLLINQTPNILLYLGQQLGLAPAFGDDSDGLYHINQLVLTALDGLCNEVHDTHHPIATSLYYEDQKDEAKRRATDYTTNRLPKFLGFFEDVLKAETSGEGPWLYGGSLTYADLVLFQVGSCSNPVVAVARHIASVRSEKSQG
jgi:glutathione S-transferase